MVSERVSQIGASETLKISAKAKELAAQGIDVVDLSVGEPDFPTPENVKRAGKQAIDADFTKYTPNPGIPELRKVICEKLKRDNNVVYSPAEVIVSSGAKNCLYNLWMAIIDEGDEVIIPAPYWVSYPQQVLLAGGKPVIVDTKEEDDFKLTPDALQAAVSFNTRALVMNNPSNPTGTAYERRELEDLCSIAAKEGIFIVADEIYEKLVYGGFRSTSVASLGDDIKAKTVIINGVSKSYSMTGWRLGYAAGPKDIISAMAKVQSHNTSNASSISQKAALEALKGPQMDVTRMVSEFQRRRNYCLQKLRGIPNVSCMEPRGAFYLFPNFATYYDKEYEGMLIRNSYGLAYYLLKYANVAVVPGNAFGNDSCIRLSYATSMEKLVTAMDRIVEAVGKLRTSRRAKRITLDNTMTHVKGKIPIEANTNMQMREVLVGEMEEHLRHDNYYEWNANIAGVVVQLRTNVKHLHEFWIENWYPSELESDLEPHAIIYAVDGIAGREPRAYYNAESKTAVLVNCDYYDHVRKLALGAVTDIVERVSETHTMHGACLDFGGRALALVAPAGVGRGTICYGLLQDRNAKIHSNDFFLVRYTRTEAIADISERKFYVRTRVAKSFDYLAPLFDRSRLENVVTRKEDCLNVDCENLDACDLDRGETHCYWGSKYCRAMLDPYWIGGVAKYAKRTSLGSLIVLRKDNVSPMVEKLKPEEALRFLEEGRFVSTGGVLTGMKTEPFFNPYILNPTRERLELHRRYFEHLLKLVPCYLVNTGADKRFKIIERLVSLASR
jgi:aspartate/methionine/tyrosine aminotransferase